MSTYNEISEEMKKRMDDSIEHLKKEFSGLRAGRASPLLLESVIVEAYGSTVPLNQVSNINVGDARSLAVQVWDKAMVKNVEKAIRDAGLGLNPSADGTTVRVPVPQLNEERRKDMVKIAGKYAEDSRVAIRSARRVAIDAIKKMEKDKVITEDDLARHEKDIQKITDENIKKVDTLFANKETDITQV
jgi:ribosome recycling factor